MTGRFGSQAGLTLTELLFVAAFGATVAGLAIPLFDHAVDDARTATAVRFLAGQIHAARLEALKRGASVALRFEISSPDYLFTPVADGNANGVRAADIAAGIDRPLGSPERLGDKFGDVRFGLLPGLPDAGGAMGTGIDGVRIGSARILTLSPDGTATPGTLYVHGRRAQYAVRVLGMTARVRVLKYDRAGGTWVTR